MAGFFKKLFNRITGKPAEDVPLEVAPAALAAPEPGPEIVLEKPVAKTAPAKKPAAKKPEPKKTPAKPVAKAKVKAVSQEAKSSAAIIGSLPFVLIGAMSLVNPNYLDPLFYTDMGHMLLIGSGTWMTIGVLVMRKMINFQI